MVDAAEGPRRRPRTVPSAAQRISPYETLKQAIFDGQLKPGEPLIETALASWYKVSRTPVREALSRLEQDGLVERSDRGLIVRRRSPEEIIDIYETRIALEATAGRMAAERRSDHDIRILRRLIQRSRDVAADDDQKADLNREFHHAIWHASHNESLRDLLTRLDLHLARYPATTLSYPNRWEEAKAEHTALVDAVEARDGSRAYEISRIHFTTARDIRIQLWDSTDV
jgi:DNA-binding GntR family transcriptional regulator